MDSGPSRTELERLGARRISIEIMNDTQQPSPSPQTLPVPLAANRLGIGQWFHYEDDASLERCVGLMRELGVRHLRTGISWADYYRPRGADWYRRMMSALQEFEILLSIWHTPPSISEGGTCASPPRRLGDFADFIDLILDEFGGGFSSLELWNEPNNRLKWDFIHYDPEWRKFGAMIGTAAYWAKQRQMPTVLGGMIPVDRHWLKLMKRYGAFPYLDAIGIHAFPGMWWPGAPNWDWHRDWGGWDEKIDSIRRHAEGRPIWVTETGLATWDLAVGREAKFDLQAHCLEEAARAPAERLYWYSLLDLDPAQPAIEGFHVDENEYHMGLVRQDGTRKEAFHRFKDLLREQAADVNDRAAIRADARANKAAL